MVGEKKLTICKHEAKELQFNKMFINENGLYGGQTITILLDCSCGATLHIFQERGNVHKEYRRPTSSINIFSSNKPSKNGRETMRLD